MIDEIQVQNLALIREATLEPSPGLTVLTGETGAGKTALLSALKLLMGERADKQVVRDGSDGLVVSGRLLVDAASLAEGDGAEACDAAAATDGGTACGTDGDAARAEIVVTRTLSAEGRSRAKVNGTMASMGELAALVAGRIDLCSQNEHQQLVKPATHVGLLDAWIGVSARDAHAAYAEAFDAAAAAAAELDRVLQAGREGNAALDEARFVLQRIEAVDPRSDEFEELGESLARAEHAETLARAARGAHEALNEEGGALDGLNAAIVSLQEGARYDAALEAPLQQLLEASYLMEDAAREALRYGESIDFDPEKLAYQQQRMADYQGLLRSYGPRIEDVLAQRDRAADAVSLVDDAELREREARRAVDCAEEALAQAADRLAQLRAARAGEFAAAVTAQMARLEMGTAKLEVGVDPLPRERWTRAGSQSVEFFFRAGASLQPRPLARIASGGEVSRVMLALKVVLGAADAVDTLVFDEIDAGVGGSTANALADVLADLAHTHQVIVVTHLAQVAVRGDTHYVVEKQAAADDAGLPQTQLRRLSPDERPAEIARMLSGDVTPASLQHAAELLSRV